MDTDQDCIHPHVSTSSNAETDTSRPIIRPRHVQSRSRSRPRYAADSMTSTTAHKPRPARRVRSRRAGLSPKLAILSLLSASTTVAAECIPLKGSTTCLAFQSASVSTNKSSTGFYSFLNFVSDVASFDQQLQLWIHQGHVQEM